jgi:two-component system sensor histidine kinase KdpD
MGEPSTPRTGASLLDRLGPGRPLGWRRSMATVLVCTLVSELMAPYSDLQDVIMVYLAGVVYVSLHEGLRVSVATVLASIFLFDLLVVPPRWGLNPVHPSHFVTLAVMLGVGLLISSLSARAQQHAALAERRAQRAQSLTELAARLTSAGSREQVEQAVAAAARAALGVACKLQDDGSLHVEPGERAPNAEEHELLEGFERQARLALERCTFEQRSREAVVAAETERLRSTLLSGISHDFRTPLTTIIGAATSLREQHERLDERMRTTLVDGILADARRLHERLSHLLDLTRMEEGGAQPSPEWCPADDLVAEALQLLGGRTRTHEVEVDAAADTVVWCDPRLVEQALSNMVDNAVRYTPPGTRIRIGVALDGGSWELRVADDGPGLPSGAAQDIFRKYRRGQKEAAGTGFGLGLAICAAVARLHGGTVTAHGERGAVFTMRLPQPARRPMEEEA